MRLRLKVEWRDGGSAAARSVIGDLLGRGCARYVATPATKSGATLRGARRPATRASVCEAPPLESSSLRRENCRFAMFGVGGCPVDAVNEPFSTGLIGDHSHEIVDLCLAFANGLKARAAALASYRRPARSVLARAAKVVQNGLTLSRGSISLESRLSNSVSQAGTVGTEAIISLQGLVQ